MPRLMFQRPRRIEWEDLTATFGRMTAEPFEKGYALTVGGSLRRVLLSAIPARPWCGPRALPPAPSGSRASRRTSRTSSST